MKQRRNLFNLKLTFILVLLLFFFIACQKQSLGQGGFERPGRDRFAQEFLETKDGLYAVSGLSLSTGIIPIEENVDEADLEYSVYRVKSGDMIGVLADEFGLTQDTLISVNAIKQTRLLQVGQYLKVPSMSGIVYTVRTDGETIDAIAKKYEVDEEKCAKTNSLLVSENLKAGTSLFVPDAELDWVTRQEINGDLFIRPLRSSYYFSSYFGWRNSPFTGQRTFHNGIDMAAPRGTYIYPALAGTVTTVSYDNVYGNYVIVTHHSGYKTLYGHMSETLARKGQSVNTETRIGRVGNTGLSTGNHLHFTVFKNGVAVNPQALWR